MKSKENPFELKFNRKKHEILNRQQSKVGKPGLKKRQTEEKRREFIDGYSKRGNLVKDKRIQKGSKEDQNLHRFMKLKQNKFSLEEEPVAEEEILTHFGKNLNEIEHFHMPEDDEDYDLSQIDGQPKSRKEIMKEIIQKSKKHKRERQQQKEFDDEIRAELDDELGAIRELLSLDKDEQIIHETGKDKEYDSLVKEMQFEKRAKPTDRQKTEEEIALDEAKKLEQLEKERQQRMHQKIQVPKKRKAQADDLIEYEAEQETTLPLTYKDGKLVNNEIFMKPGEGLENEDYSGDESEDENSVFSEAESEDSKNLSDEDVELSDNGESESESNEESGDEIEDSVEAEKNEEAIKLDIEKAASELPYTFEAPSNYEEYEELLRDLNYNDIDTVLQRLRIQYNIKIKKENSQKLQKLLVFVLKMMINEKFNRELYNVLRKHYIALGKQFPEYMGKWCKRRISYLQKLLQKEIKKERSGLPGLQDLLIIRDLQHVYSVSDYRHPVITPLFLYLGQVLAQAPILTKRDAIYGLFISQFVAQFVSQSKRFVPELFQFLPMIIGKLTGKQSEYLCTSRVIKIDLKINDYSKQEELSLENISGPHYSEAIMVSMLQECILILGHLLQLYGDEPAIQILYSPLLDILDSIDQGKQLAQKTRMILESLSLKRKPLKLQERKAMAIKTYQPKFQKNFSVDRKSYHFDKDVREQQKHRAEYKKEMKSAIKELRSDAEFMVRNKIADTKRKDQEYKKKMDRIHGMLAEQEGAMRGFERETAKEKRKSKKAK